MLHNFPVNRCKLHLNAFDDLSSQAALQSFLINGTNARPRGILWTPVRIRNPSKECTGVDLGHLSHPSLKTLLPSKSMYLRMIEWIRHSQKRLKGRLDIQHLRKWHRCRLHFYTVSSAGCFFLWRRETIFFRSVFYPLLAADWLAANWPVPRCAAEQGSWGRLVLEGARGQFHPLLQAHHRQSLNG